MVQNIPSAKLCTINCGPPQKYTTVQDGRHGAYLCLPHCSVHQAGLNIYKIHKVQLATKHAQCKLNLPSVAYISTSVVKSQGVRSSYQTRNRPKFVFGAENGLFGHFRLFPFSAENEFSFLFYFSFSSLRCHLRWVENVMFATKR